MAAGLNAPSFSKLLSVFSGITPGLFTNDYILSFYSIFIANFIGLNLANNYL